MVEKLRIGIAGLGTVGSEVVTMLQMRAGQLSGQSGRQIEIVGVCARDRTRMRPFTPGPWTWYDTPEALAVAPDVDIFVELIGGEDGPALNAVTLALQHGRHVVTANKALLARHGLELARLAEAGKVALAFEAAVAGGVPVIKMLREGLAGSQINRISGILNGTCNYILSKMETEGLSFADGLAEAQRLGYAEADPTFDIGGFDTAHKLALLTSLAFGTAVDRDAIHIEGIESITLADIRAAAALGFRVKLLGVAERNEHGIEQRVHPTMITHAAPLSQVMGVTNAVSIDADAHQRLTLIGPGAGGKATAAAVMADITDIARGNVPHPFAVPATSLTPGERVPMQAHRGGYYIRMFVEDRPGAFATIATRMAEHGISLESIMQRSGTEHFLGATCVPVVLITHATTEKLVRDALDAVLADGYVSERPQIFRIERE
ncbi:MAG: homoserine dehydrogenase [Hyphomicrobiales bacterium]|nr:homoserine dehydrogenase [Hyphomicrobiales bacterium]